jgi:hypothetical protein
MILKDIINKAIQILGLESEISVDVPSQNLTRLSDCANMILGELTQEYIHLKNVEKIHFSDGRAYYGAFSKNVREILSVKVDNIKKDFCMYPLYLFSEGLDGDAEVTYLYHLSSLSLNSAVELPPQYTVYTLALGTVSEYCSRTGMAEEAMFYKSRYETSVVNLSRRLRNSYLPARRLV